VLVEIDGETNEELSRSRRATCPNLWGTHTALREIHLILDDAEVTHATDRTTGASLERRAT
jgi:hypothetical protein